MSTALEDHLANLRAYLQKQTPGSPMHQAVTEAIHALEDVDGACDDRRTLATIGNAGDDRRTR